MITDTGMCVVLPSWEEHLNFGYCFLAALMAASASCSVSQFATKTRCGLPVSTDDRSYVLCA